jgi:hypothetical protein
MQVGNRTLIERLIVLIWIVDYTTHGFPPGWPPIGFENTTSVQLHFAGVSVESFGIPGSGGKLFAFL